MLTDQQKHACRNYVTHFNWQKAMRDAGYSAKTADKHGYKLFKDPSVAMYIKSLMDKAQKKTELSAENVLEELRRLAFSNIKDFYKWSEFKGKYVLKTLDELTPQQTACIKKYTPGEGYELYTKDGALDKLAKYFKLYNEIDATVTNFVLMPELKLNGKPLEFNIGKAAPKRACSAEKN